VSAKPRSAAPTTPAKTPRVPSDAGHPQPRSGTVLGAIFLATIVGQAFVGQDDFNHGQLAHHEDPVSLARYVRSSDFWVDVLENWQSEYLQFTLFVVATVWLLQRGSPESKEVDKAGHRVGRGAAHRLSCGRALAALGSRRWVADAHLFQLAVAGDGGYLDRVVARSVRDGPDRLQRGAVRPPAGRGELAGLRRHFGPLDRTLQNWQSEFLAVGSMAVLAIYLRQRGSPESKPVGAPHDATGVEG
jgi:hypothetical protein